MKSKRVHKLAVNGLTTALALMIALIPFHAFLTVWASSIVGHYTALRLWKEALLAVAVMLTLYLIITVPKLRKQVFDDRLWRVVALYVTVTVVWGVVAYLHGNVSRRAMFYGILINTRFIFVFFAAWVAASQSPWLRRYWQRLLAYPAIGVVGFGLAQKFLLPHDFLKHFGYGTATISPYETIDHKVSYIRVASTLRGANLFGGYLIILISYLAAVSHWVKKRWLVGVAIVLSLAALYASGSRGAWLGAIVALATVAGIRLGPKHILNRRVAFVAVLSIILISAGLIGLRNNDFVQNTFFHTDEHSSSSTSSNTAHFNATWSATTQVFSVNGILGSGTGTAGQASFHNTSHPARVAENYFLQIGQESGWLGLGLFLAIYASVAQLLWRKRKTTLGQTLLASLAGLTVMAMLMHIWSDDSISYLWWSLAGLAIAPSSSISNKVGKR